MTSVAAPAALCVANAGAGRAHRAPGPRLPRTASRARPAGLWGGGGGAQKGSACTAVPTTARLHERSWHIAIGCFYASNADKVECSLRSSTGSIQAYSALFNNLIYIHFLKIFPALFPNPIYLLIGHTAAPSPPPPPPPVTSHHPTLTSDQPKSPAHLTSLLSVPHHNPHPVTLTLLHPTPPHPTSTAHPTRTSVREVPIPPPPRLRSSISPSRPHLSRKTTVS